MNQISIGKYPYLNDVLNSIGGLKKYINKNETVFIKPNICCPKTSDTGAVTSPRLIEELIILLQKITPNIFIGDSGFSEFKGLEAIKVSGIYDVAVKHNVKVINLNKAEKVKKGNFIVSKIVVESDKIINVPVLKTHERAGVTISLKNMMGIIPGHLKTDLHKRGLEKSIVELAQTVKPHLNIVDANICQEGRGPTNGTPKKMGLIIAGDNQVAVDSVCCELMGIKPRAIPYIRLAEKQGLGSTKDIAKFGFKEEYISKFELPPTYKNKLFGLGMRIGEKSFRKFIEKNSRIEINEDKCTQCGLCIKTCPVGAITMQGMPVVDYNKCISCLCCYETCMSDAIRITKPKNKLFSLAKTITGFRGV